MYVHMPKTGGNWVRNFMRRNLGPVEEIHGTHTTFRVLDPDQIGSRRLFGTIRNPWDWYLSLYQYAMAHPLEIERLEVYGAGSHEFRDVLWGMTHPEPDRIPDWLGVIWRLRGPPAFGSDPEAFVASGRGLWSWVVWNMYRSDDGWGVPVLIDTDRLYEGVEELFGIAVDPEAYPPKNTKDGRPISALADPRSLYDQETVRWVWEGEGMLTEAMGYMGPFKPLQSPLVRP
jgi:hypothetical protein